MQQQVLEGRDSAFLLRMLDKERLVQLNMQISLEKQLLTEKADLAAKEMEALREELELMKHLQELHLRKFAEREGPARQQSESKEGASGPSLGLELRVGEYGAREVVEAIRMKRGLGFQKGSAERE
jgi:hypothetical protein